MWGSGLVHHEQQYVWPSERAVVGHSPLHPMALRRVPSMLLQVRVSPLTWHYLHQSMRRAHRSRTVHVLQTLTRPGPSRILQQGVTVEARPLVMAEASKKVALLELGDDFGGLGATLKTGAFRVHYAQHRALAQLGASLDGQTTLSERPPRRSARPARQGHPRLEQQPHLRLGGAGLVELEVAGFARGDRQTQPRRTPPLPQAHC